MSSNDRTPLLPATAGKSLNQPAPQNTFKTHLRVAAGYILTVLASGILIGFPTIEPLLIEDGVFGEACGKALRSAPSSFLESGMIILARGRLLYLAFPMADSFGSLVSFALYGFLWHYPKNQALIANSSYQVSGALGFLIKAMVEGGITVYYSFLVIAAFCVVAGVLAWFVIPDQSEMLERAEHVLGMDPRPTHGMSLWRKVKATFNVMGQYKSENVLFFLWLLSAYVFFLYWDSVLDYYVLYYMNANASKIISDWFAVTYGIFGALLSPFMGLLLDRIGMSKFMFSLLVTQVVFFITLFIPTLATQVISMVAGVVYLSAFIMVLGKWAIWYAPPDLLGTYYGIMLSVVGLMQIAINSIVVELMLTYAPAGLHQYLGPLAVMGAISIICTVAIFLRLRVHGTPDVPPQPK